jgi:hypothetical protein
MGVGMKVFISGPYTHPDPAVNVRNAVLAAEEVVKKGHTPYIPHLSHLWHLISPHPIDFWYQYDLEWLKCCDVIWRLQGYSEGADAEVNFARTHKIKVIYDIDQL